MPDINVLHDLPDVSFIENLTLEQMQGQMISDFQTKYEELTEKKVSLGAADPNRLILYACALQLYQGFQNVDKAGKMNLLKYSYDEFLDNLGALLGVSRSKPTAASVYIEFTLSSERETMVIIPAGTKVTTDFSVYFQTTKDEIINAGELSAVFLLECTESGTIGNNYKPGEINILVDPLPYILSVINTSTSSGGADIESNKSYAERIFIAPSSFSVAGPDDAYIYHVKSFSPLVDAVRAYEDEEAVVHILFTLQNGELPPDTIIEEVRNFLETKQVRPLTDNVIVSAPDVVEFSIELTYYIKRSDSNQIANIQARVNAAVDDFIVWQKSQIGQDINDSELIKRVREAGAKRVTVTDPQFTVISDTAIAVCSNKNIIFGGIEND